MSEIMTGSVSANGIDFHYLEAGKGPLVLCMHGFPDNANSYRALMPLLADAGYHVVAPFMRGYAPTSLAPDGRYDSALLGLDVAALIDALGEGHAAAVIGHDWGAFATYSAAAFVPVQTDKIVTIAITHYATLLGKIGHESQFINGGGPSNFFKFPILELAEPDNDT